MHTATHPSAPLTGSFAASAAERARLEDRYAEPRRCERSAREQLEERSLTGAMLGLCAGWFAAGPVGALVGLAAGTLISVR